VTFRPDSVPGAPPPGAPLGQVDYRLARNAIVSEFRKGRLSRTEVCDAHPELLRAARNVGSPKKTEECPICEGTDLMLVSYVFGGRLPAHGRCLTSGAELMKLARRPTEFTCYVVEVCPDCSWNHLARAFPVGGRHQVPAP
jgi:hypothetical protein